MASEKGVTEIRGSKVGAAVIAKVAHHRVQFWASCMDAFLQEYLKAAEENDALGVIVASARLAQLASTMGTEYKKTVEHACSSQTELRCAKQQTEMVVRMINDNGDQCVAIAQGEAALAAEEPEPDRSLS